MANPGDVLTYNGPSLGNVWQPVALNLSTSFTQDGTGAVAQTVLSMLKRQVITPEDFGAVGDGVTDDFAAFQLAANRVYAMGGGTVELRKAKYFLGQYTGTQVGGAACENAISGATASNVWVLPSNTSIRGVGLVELSFASGTTSPFGYTLTGGLSSAPFTNESSTTVSSVNMTTNSCVVASTTNLAVGQTVRLCRQGGNTGGNPNTPSYEDSPNQFLTIISIVGTTVTFNESFIHRFDAAQNLFLKYRVGIDYPRNIFLENLKITSASGLHTYCLHSRTINSGWKNVQLGPKVSHSWGTAQKASLDNVQITLDPTDKNTITIESTSDVDIGTITVEGNGTNNGLGGLFFSDNCKSVRLKKLVGRNCAGASMAAFYGIDAEIDQIDLSNCGTASNPTSGFSGAVTLGYPAVGAHPSLAVAELNTYLCKNIGNSKIVIRKFKCVGPTQVPIRAHDCDLTIDEADIEFANPGSSAPFMLGQSGNRRADATYFPNGGQSRFRLGKVSVRTLSGSAATILDTNGLSGLFREGTATITIAASIGATTITVDDPTQFRANSILYFVDESSSNVAAAQYLVNSIAGSVLTLNSALTQNIPINTKCWSSQPNRNVAQAITCGLFVLDGVVANLPVGQGDALYVPDFQAGAGPYTTTQTFTLPSEGDWNVLVSIISTDYAHSVTAEYLATYSTLNAAQSHIAQKWASTIGTNVAINSTSQSAKVITFTFQSSTQGKTARVSIRATPYRHIFGPEA